MTTAAIVAELGAQHARLRQLMDHCDALLVAAEAGQLDLATLLTQVRQLRAALTDHHAFEEQHLTLFGGDAHHPSHHAALALGLDDPAVRALAAVLRDLRAHLSHEDRVLASLTP